MMLSAFPPCYLPNVPRKPATEGDPDEKVKFQMEMPVWLKRKALAHMRTVGKTSLGGLIIDLLVSAVGGNGKKEGGRRP
jgi:hypothetical protein